MDGKLVKILIHSQQWEGVLVGLLKGRVRGYVCNSHSSLVYMRSIHRPTYMLLFWHVASAAGTGQPA